MIIAFGDSFTYGFNFNESERLNNVYPTLLGKKLNQPVLNTALPGASNWRIARMIQSMNITKDDIVIISWTEPTRFELGVNKRHYVPPIKENRIGDLNETDGDLITKRFFIQLTDRTTDKDAKKINELGEYNRYDAFNFTKNSGILEFRIFSAVRTRDQLIWRAELIALMFKHHRKGSASVLKMLFTDSQIKTHLLKMYSTNKYEALIDRVIKYTDIYMSAKDSQQTARIIIDYKNKAQTLTDAQTILTDKELIK